MGDSLDAIADRDLKGGTRKGLDDLRSALEDEIPVMAINARPDDELTNGILLLTTRRLLLVKRGVLRSYTTTIELPAITALDREGSAMRKLVIRHDTSVTRLSVDAQIPVVDAFIAATNSARHDDLGTEPPSPATTVSRGRPTARTSGTFVDVTGGQRLAVVGESNYQPALAAFIEDPRFRQDLVIPTWAVLVAEPDNPHDENAVQVVVRNERVGYLSADNAERFAPFFQTHAGAYCPAIIGGHPGYRGVVLRVDYDLLEDPDTGEETPINDLLWT